MKRYGHSRRRCRRRFRSSLLAGTALVSVLAGGGMALAAMPNALPSGGRVTAGQAAISQNGSAMTITQTSSKAILNWQGFDIGKQASVTFQQPDASAMALNRVTAGDASQIEGRLSANGQVVLVNPNGVVFGAGATVNAGGLVASTMDIKDADFQAGNMTFQRNGAAGAVVNHGTITTARGGYAALIGAKVTTDGLIEARMGTVALAAGEAAVLNFDGTSLVGVQVQPSTVASLIDAGGIIRAGGGKVLLTAEAANQLLGGAINADGVIEATSLSKVGGRISLQASGPITIAGAEIKALGASGGGSIAIGDMAATASVTVDAASSLDASATAKGDGGSVVVKSQATAFHGKATARGGTKGGKGGHVETSGESLNIAGARVDVAAPLGGRGTWLLDPTDFIVDANAATAINAALNGSGPNANGQSTGADVTIATFLNTPPTVTGANASSGPGDGGNGDIVVAAPISWTTDQTLSLNAYHSVLIQAPVTASGNHAGLAINTGGNFYTAATGSVTLSGTNPSLTLAIGSPPAVSFTLISTASQLQNIGLAGTYALANDITLPNSRFVPIGFLSGDFTGTLDGLGHSIKNLQIFNIPGNNIGLISSLTGTVRNLTISNGVLYGGGNSNIGMVAGQATGTIENVTASGIVSADDGTQFIGGLVGFANGTILYGSFDGGVTAGANAANVGGLVGGNFNTIQSSYSRGSVISGSGSTCVGGLVGFNYNLVSASFSAANVTVGNGTGDKTNNYFSDIGGLIGINDHAVVTSSYATGNVVGGDAASNIGGLIGLNDKGSLVNSVYATGAVSAGANAKNIGGLVGFDNAGAQNAYATGAVAGGPGATNIGGLIGDNEITENGDSRGVNTLYWTLDSTGQGSAFGFTVPGTTSSPVGLTNAQSADIHNYPAFLPADWFQGSNGPPALVKPPFVLKVTPANKSAPYGAAVPAFTDTIASFWAGDAFNLLVDPPVTPPTPPQLPVLTSPAGATPAAGSYAITASGASATSLNGSAYQFDYLTGRLTISKAQLTITANSASKTYGQDISPTADGFNGFTTLASNGVTTGKQLFNGDSVTGVTMTSNGAAAAEAAGSYSITTSGATGSGLGNYTITYNNTGNNAGTLTVNKAQLLVTADPQTMSYGGALPALTASYSGWVNGDTPASLISAATVTVSSSFAATAAGVYSGALVATGASAANYSISYNPGTLTITPASLVVTADAKSMTYGGSLPALTASYSGWVNGDTASVLTQPATVSSSVPANSGAGVYSGALVASGASAANYSISYNPGTLTITPASLVVTADAKSMTYGGSLPALTASYSGWVNGDTLSVLTQPATVSSSVPASSGTGVYSNALAASGASAANYSISYQPGTLTIGKAALTVIADARSMTYGGTLPALTASYSGLVNGDTVSSLAQGATVTSTVAASANAGVYTGALVASGASSANYAISYQAGSLTINRALLTWSVADATAIAGGVPKPGAATLKGLVNGDPVSATVGLFHGEIPMKLSADLPVGAYAETVTALTGPLASNYALATTGNRPGTLTILSPQTLPWLVLLRDDVGRVGPATSTPLNGALAVAESGEDSVCVEFEWDRRITCDNLARLMVRPLPVEVAASDSKAYVAAQEAELVGLPATRPGAGSTTDN